MCGIQTHDRDICDMHAQDPDTENLCGPNVQDSVEVQQRALEDEGAVTKHRRRIHQASRRCTLNSKRYACVALKRSPISFFRMVRWPTLLTPSVLSSSLLASPSSRVPSTA